MKRLMQITLAAAVVALAAGPALAQQRQRQGGGFGFGGFGGVAMLLGQESVQKELKLSDEQVKEVQKLMEKQREAFQGFGELSQEERRTKMQELNKSNNEAVAKILKPEQLKRAKQIALQRQGAAAVNNEEVAKELKITDEQKQKIRAIQTKAREDMQGAGSDEEGRKKRQEVMTAMNEKIMGVLTAEQKEQLRKMQGEPFKGEIRFGRPRQR